MAQHPPPSDNTNPAVYDGPMLFKYVLLQAHSSSSSKLKNVLSERGKVLSIVEDDPNHTWLAHRLVGILEHNMLLRSSSDGDALESFRSLEEGFWNQYFTILTSWSSSLSHAKKEVWLSYRGIPVHACSPKILTKIVGLFGRVVKVDTIITLVVHFETEKVKIVVNECPLLDENVILNFVASSYSVWVVKEPLCDNFIKLLVVDMFNKGDVGVDFDGHTLDEGSDSDSDSEEEGLSDPMLVNMEWDDEGKNVSDAGGERIFYAGDGFAHYGLSCSGASPLHTLKHVTSHSYLVPFMSREIALHENISNAHFPERNPSSRGPSVIENSNTHVGPWTY
ncbi:hypothetical protein KIW84_041076 [Lathyrus oleraceus]|uniref:DUF4283 domain-containing protein n=1 Tax=Pisum sativum TaxID=3888 RepID=A0A9D4X910_PEA|nr:hypothetical protein KIW84_041076 [Pisum sativum]